MNALLSFDSTHQWQLAGWTMVHFLWIGALVAVVSLLCRIMLRSAAPNIRYATALACLAILSAMPVATAMWLAANSTLFTFTDSPSPGGAIEGTAKFDAAPLAADTKVIENRIVELSELAPTNIASTPAAKGDAALATPTHTEPTLGHSLTGMGNSLANLQRFVAYLPWLWIIGTPVTFVLLAVGLVGTKRLRQASRAIDDSQITEMVKRLAASLRVRARVGLAVCDRIAAPVLIGILRPIILLPPAAITGWSPDEIEMVLLHELAHVRRWDNLVNLLQRCIESLLFFHPAVWLVSSWVRREREACCDAIVVSRTQRPHAYAELLVALAAQMPRSVLFHPAASSAMAAGPLRKRIRRILQLDDDPMLISGKSLMLMLGTLVFAATLAVFYLPTIGQAEESTNEITESTEPAAKQAEAIGAESRNADWTLGKEFPKSVMHERFSTRVYAVPIDRVPVEKRVEFERQISQFDPSRNSTFKWENRNLIVWGPPEMHTHLAELFERGIHEFPSLEEQKLADLVWKRLRLELEPISAEDMKRVQAHGYDGGLRVSGKPKSVAKIGADPAGDSIVTGDILVGLHVWPTTTMKSLADILSRDDINELSPLKFYVVRQLMVAGTPDKPIMGDVMRTGRVSANSNDGGEFDSYKKASEALARRIQSLAAPISNTDVPPFVLPSPEDEADLPKKPPVIPGATPSSDTDRKRRTQRPTQILAASAGKESLRYDGKTFDDWRNQWQNELSNEKRAEAVKALAAFGRAGYGKEATEAILDVAGNYDFYAFTNDDAEIKLKDTIIKELVLESGNHELSKYWLPDVAARLKRDPEKWKDWASNLLHKVYSADPAGQTLLKSLAHEGPSDVRSAALGALIRASRSPDRKLVLDEETHKLLRDALQSDDRMMVQYALQYLTYPVTAGVEPPTLLFQPELVSLLFHADENVQGEARRCLQNLDAKDTPQVLDQLMNALEDSPEKPGRRRAAIRALGAMGEKAESAIPSLKDLVKPSADESTLFATYVALDAITREKHKRNYASFGIGEFTEDLSGDDEKAVREKMEYGSPKFNGAISQEMQAILPQQLGGGGGFF